MPNSKCAAQHSTGETPHRARFGRHARYKYSRSKRAGANGMVLEPKQVINVFREYFSEVRKRYGPVCRLGYSSGREYPGGTA